jgi:N-acetylglucosaminyldiphosphoundecaprenol N-acetyl-beta-D-mannosaminyltransferase
MSTITKTSTPSIFPAVRILGLNVHDVDMKSTLDAIDEFVRDGSPHHLVTADASMLVMAQDDPELRTIISRAELVTPDSVGVLWAAKRQQQRLRERVSGVEIVENLCARSAQSGYRLYFLGAGPGVAEQAATRMREKYPGAQVVGTRDGFFKPEDAAEIVAEIRRRETDIICVALGIPKQEKWIAAHRNQLGAAVLIGVGGTFDVLSGNVKRAPRWMQKAKLEWLWRLISNPKKIGKVMMLPRFVKLVLSTKPS